MKKQVVLIIDTSKSDEVVVGIENGDKSVERKAVRRETRAQAVLPMIEALLKEADLTLKDISEISVNTGPGSFTGLRVGIAVANTLATLLKVPLNGKSVGTLAAPQYESSKFD